MPIYNNRCSSSKNMDTIPFLYQYEMINKIRKKCKNGGNNNNYSNNANKSHYRGGPDIHKIQTPYYHRYDMDQSNDNNLNKQHYSDYSRNSYQYYNGNKNYQGSHLQHNSSNNISNMGQSKSYIKPQSVQLHQHVRQPPSYRVQDHIHNNVSSINGSGFMPPHVSSGNNQSNLPLNSLDRFTPSPVSLDMILDKQSDKFSAKNISLPDVSISTASSISSISKVPTFNTGVSELPATDLTSITSYDVNFDPFYNKGTPINTNLNTANSTGSNINSSLSNFDQSSHTSPLLSGIGVNNYISSINSSLPPLMSHDIPKLPSLNSVLDTKTTSTSSSQDGSIHKSIGFDSKSLINLSGKESSEFPDTSLAYNDSSLLFTKNSQASIWGSDTSCVTQSNGFPHTSGDRLTNTSDTLNVSKHFSSFSPLSYDSALLNNSKPDFSRGSMNANLNSISANNKGTSSFIASSVSQFPSISVSENNDGYPNLMSSSNFF